MEKSFLFLIFSILNVIYFTSGQLTNAFGRNDSIELQFRDFVIKFKKSYHYGSEEYSRRMFIFESNMKFSTKLNSLRTHPDSAWYGMTKFSDLTDGEFRDKYLSSMKLGSLSVSPQTIESTARVPYPSDLRDVPKTFDWRNFGIITEPRDQMHCGSCWAFASVEAMESMYAKRTKQLVALSVQQMVDCSYNFTPNLKGCSGGYTCDALKWANMTKTVLVPEADYPYVGHEQPCRRSAVAKSNGPTVTDYTCNNFAESESLMLSEIATVGPLAVAVDASNWKNYLGGVIQFHCGEIPNNHAVQIVGYNLTGPIPYYIVKNSWGTEFGHSGYLYIKYGSNVCSIASVVSTVQMST